MQFRILKQISAHTTPDTFLGSFLRNLAPAFLGEGVVIGISLFVYIIAIRILGPTEFGQWSIVSSVGEMAIIIPLFGLAAASLVHIGANKNNAAQIIGTASITAFILSLLIFPLYFIASPLLAPLFGIHLTLFQFGISYGIFVLWAQLFQSFFKGIGSFTLLAYFLILSAFGFATATFGSMFIFSVFSYQSIFWGNIVRTGIMILLGIYVFRKHLRIFNKDTFKQLTSYGTLSMISGFIGFFSLGSIDTLMINYFMGPSAVGVYAAYYIVFGLLAGKILGTVMQVFLPLVSGVSDIRTIFKWLTVFIIPTGVILIIGSIFTTWITFFFYGSAFPFNIGIAFWLSLAASLYFIKAPFENILASRGIIGMRFGPLLAILLGISNVTFNYLLIPLWGLYGAALATSISAGIALVVTIYITRRYFVSPQE